MEHFFFRKVVECRNDLQRAHNIVKRLDDDLNDLDKFLIVTDKELTKWETSEPSKLKEEVHYVEVKSFLLEREDFHC